MADAPSLVGLGVRSPDIAGKLSQLLSIQAQKQALEGQRAEVASAQQSQQQRSAIANYMKRKLGTHIAEDGTLDLEALSSDPELLDAAGDKAPDVLSSLATVKGQQLEAKKSLFALHESQRHGVAEMAGSLLSDPDIANINPDAPDAEEKNEKAKQKLNVALEQYYETHGKDVIPAIAAYVPAIKNAPPGALSNVLRTIRMGAMSVDQQAAAQQPHLVDTGAELTNTNPNAAPMPSLKKSVAPGSVVLTDAKGAQFSWNPSTNSVTPVGSGRGPASPPKPTDPVASPKPSFTQPTYMGQEKDIASNQDEVGRIRAAADTAPQNRDIFKHILKLADDTNTGPLVNFFQKTAIGGQVFGDNYQELAKYLEKQAIGQMQAMGGPASDARLSAAVAANGSTTFNPKALKAVTQFNHAVNTGLEEYRQGIDHAIGTSNPDYTALPKFKADWAKNFSIDVFRLQNAIEDGDERAKAEVLNGLSDKEADALVKKLDNLESLSKTGHLSK